jgi:hypothetical protein
VWLREAICFEMWDWHKLVTDRTDQLHAANSVLPVDQPADVL